MNLLVRATNWVGDAVMSLPALAAVRARFPEAHIAVLARPWVADLYRHEPFADEIIPYQPGGGWRGWRERRRAAAELRARRFDCALLLQNAFDAALIAWLAGIPRRIGYSRDARRWLLTDAVPRPRPGAIPPHESFYYLELLRRIGWLGELPPAALIRLEGRFRAREAGARRWAQEGWTGAIVGVSPGAAYGNAKRWLPERFAEAAARVARETGARGLRSIIEAALLDVMFEIPSHADVQRVIVDADTINGVARPKIVVEGEKVLRWRDDGTLETAA